MGVNYNCCCEKNYYENLENTLLTENDINAQKRVSSNLTDNYLTTEPKSDQENQNKNQNQNSNFFIQKEEIFNTFVPSRKNEYSRNNSLNSLQNSNDYLKIQMEINLFELINNLRTEPQKFIKVIEKYKNLIQKDSFTNENFIFIDNHKINLYINENDFNNCENILQNTKNGLKKFNKDKNLFFNENENFIHKENESSGELINNMFKGLKKKMENIYTEIDFFEDNNINDINFFLTMNLVGNNYERENCLGKNKNINLLLSKKFDYCNVVIKKIDQNNNVFNYKIFFAKSKSKK